MEDLSQYLPYLLGIAGAVLQFAIRQFKGLHDWVFYLVTILLCAAVYLLVNQIGPMWRVEVVRFLVWLGPSMLTVMGGTFLMSNGAKAGSTSLPEPLAKLLPLTDSK